MTRPTVIVTLGGNDVAFRDKARQRKEFTNPVGHSVPDLRALAAELVAIEPDELIGAVDLPKLAPLFEALRANGAGPLDVLLVATRSADESWRLGDTEALAAVLGTALPGMAASLGCQDITAKSFLVERLLTDLGAMWDESGRMLNEIGLGAGTSVHLLASGTPQLREAVKLRFLQAHDLGMIGEFTSWIVERGIAAPEPALSLFGDNGLVRGLDLLAQELRFEEIVTFLDKWKVLDPRRRAAVKQLAQFGWRLLELDIRGAIRVKRVPDALRADLDRARFPLGGQNQDDRGALDSLVPLMGHVLDAFAARWARREIVASTTLLHLVGEYVTHLACETTVGHALDPIKLAPQVAVPNSLWGREGCGHRADDNALARKLRPFGNQSSEHWKEFLGRRYARLGDLARTCLMDCSQDACAVAIWLRAVPDLTSRVECAKAYSDSGLLKRRHQGPAGHFFTVPEESEVVADWNAFAETYAWPVASADSLPEAVASMLSHVAGQPVPAARRLDAVAAAIRAELRTLT